MLIEDIFKVLFKRFFLGFIFIISHFIYDVERVDDFTFIDSYKVFEQDPKLETVIAKFIKKSSGKETYLVIKKNLKDTIIKKGTVKLKYRPYEIYLGFLKIGIIFSIIWFIICNV